MFFKIIILLRWFFFHSTWESDSIFGLWELECKKGAKEVQIFSLNNPQLFKEFCLAILKTKAEVVQPSGSEERESGDRPNSYTSIYETYGFSRNHVYIFIYSWNFWILQTMKNINFCMHKRQKAVRLLGMRSTNDWRLKSEYLSELKGESISKTNKRFWSSLSFKNFRNYAEVRVWGKFDQFY